MKTIHFLFFFIIILFTTACKKENQICVKSNFIGDFVGQTVCKSNGATGQSVPTVIRISDNNTANEVTVNVDGFIIDVVIDGCTFSGTDKNADVDVLFSGSLNKENLKVKLEGTAFNIVLDCEVEGEKN